jgi:hypothetical protein
VTKNSVTAGEDQDCHRNEGSAVGRESTASIKTTRHALLEPLQEKEEQLVMESDTTKRSIEQIGSEGGEILQSPITEQVVTAMSEKSSQAHQQCQWITKYMMHCNRQ